MSRVKIVLYNTVALQALYFLSIILKVHIFISFGANNVLLYIKYFVFTCSERNYVIGRNDNNKLMSYKKMQVENITTHSEGI